MRLLWNWAVSEGHVDDTPFRERRVKRAAPAAKLIWTDADEAALLDARDESGQGPPPLVARALLLGPYTGQRPGDLLRLGWNDLRDGGTAQELRQRKTGAEVWIPLHRRLREAIAAWARPDGEGKGDPLFVRGRRGEAIRESYLTHQVALWRELAGLPTGLTPKQWRHSAVVRLAEAGCSDRQIAAITGHRNVKTILDAYWQPTRRQARAAMARWDAAEEFRARVPHGIVGQPLKH